MASFRPINTVFGWELGWRGERGGRELGWLALLALGGPIIWVLFDAVTTGNPLYSLTGTQETVESLKRQTGPVDLVLYGPRRLGEVLQWPGMVGGFGGLLLGITLLPRRSALGFVAVVLALLAFAFLGAAGLAIIARYTMLAGAILSIFFALALLGWRFLERGNRWRIWWQAFAGLVLLMVLVWLPNQWDLDRQVHTDLTNQGQIENDLTDLVNEGAFDRRAGRSRCRTIAPCRGSRSASTCGRPTSSAPPRRSRPKKSGSSPKPATTSSRPAASSSTTTSSTPTTRPTSRKSNRRRASAKSPPTRSWIVYSRCG